MIGWDCLCIEVDFLSKRPRPDLEEGAVSSFLTVVLASRSSYLTIPTSTLQTIVIHLFTLGLLSSSGRKCKAGGTQLETGRHPFVTGGRAARSCGAALTECAAVRCGGRRYVAALGGERSFGYLKRWKKRSERRCAVWEARLYDVLRAAGDRILNSGLLIRRRQCPWLQGKMSKVISMDV